jgi:Recombination endonuclease VII/HNH endonuclease
MKGKAKIPNLSHNRVREALDYNPSTGVFIWKIDPGNNRLIGKEAGSSGGKLGYRYIRIDNEEITISRLAWFYMTGKWPERRVRFKNSDNNDCRFENLTLFNGLAGKFNHKTREGRQAYQNAYRKLTPVAQKARALRDSFNLSLEKYEIMFAAQNGKCAICEQPETHKRNGKIKALAVDHDHKTGAIRGLLCSDCNTGIGKLKDSSMVLRKAAEYLEYRLGNPSPQTGLADVCTDYGDNPCAER